MKGAVVKGPVGNWLLVQWEEGETGSEAVSPAGGKGGRIHLSVQFEEMLSLCLFKRCLT